MVVIEDKKTSPCSAKTVIREPIAAIQDDVMDLKVRKTTAAIDTNSNAPIVLNARRLSPNIATTSVDIYAYNGRYRNSKSTYGMLPLNIKLPYTTYQPSWACAVLLKVRKAHNAEIATTVRKQRISMIFLNGTLSKSALPFVENSAPIICLSPINSLHLPLLVQISNGDRLSRLY